MDMDRYRERETRLLLAVICPGTPARGKKKKKKPKQTKPDVVAICLVFAFLEFCTTVAFLVGRVFLCFYAAAFCVEGKDIVIAPACTVAGQGLGT